MYRTGRQTFIAREGWPSILLLIFLSLISYKLAGLWIALPIGLLVLLIAFLYRDPQRAIPPLPLAVLSPVDGVVLFVKQGHDPYLERPSYQIRLRIRRLGIFGLRSPIEGKLMDQWFFQSGDDDGPPQLMVSSADGHASYYVHWIQTDEKDNVVFALEAPYYWQRPTCYVSAGERVGQGQRCGRMRFGGFVDLYIPASAGLNVVHGDSVSAGVSVLATLNH